MDGGGGGRQGDVGWDAGYERRWTQYRASDAEVETNLGRPYTSSLVDRLAAQELASQVVFSEVGFGPAVGLAGVGWEMAR